MQHKSGTFRFDAPARRTLRKVPEITAYFWILKVLTTAMGEATSDFSVREIDPYLAVGLGAVAFAAALVLQLSVPRYIAGVYWLAVVMVAIFGTMVRTPCISSWACPTRCRQRPSPSL